MEERISVCEEGEDSVQAQRLRNKHGFCDLAQAFLSTPIGRALLPAHVPTSEFSCGTVEEPYTGEEFAILLQSLDEAAYEELFVVHLLSLQEDAGAVNLMLQASSFPPSFRLVLIDTVDCFANPQNADRSSSSSESSSGSSSDGEDAMDDMLLLRGQAGEYPIILEMTPATKPPTERLRQRVAGIDPSAVESLLRSKPEASSVRGLSEGAVQAALARLAALKAQMDRCRGESCLRDIAFAVVPAWGGAWAAAKAVGHTGPVERACSALP